MAYEVGGRADKSGNRFEYNWTINKVLEVLNEKIVYLTIEAVGDDERGVDLWIGNKDGSCEGQQCKGRVRSNEYWTYGAVKEKGIWDKWKFQLESSKTHSVSLVSPLTFTLLEDLAQRARTTDIKKTRDFYDYQINKSGADTVKLFHQYCGVMGLDPSKENELETAIDYLSRTYYRKFDDFELREILIEKIGLLFIGDAEEIYAKFLKFIVMEDVWGKKIDALMITNYCKENGIVFRNLARDTRILPVISDLNKEYKSIFRKFRCGYIIRYEANTCWQWILEGKSIIIHGHAGMGKSGCIENIIQFCEKDNILYLAVKLDKRIPHETSERWGQSMGLPSSVSHCLNAMSYDKKAVLIFDQLDALRWTQAHSSESLAICRKIIQEVEQINQEREQKISIIMVCRTYDLENDHNIRGLFENSSKSDFKIEWKKICVNKLTLSEVKTVVGTEYNSLSQKTRELLSTASNLYIWEQLDIRQEIEISTKQQLVQKWWEQLRSKADRCNLNSDKLEKIKVDFIKYCDRNGKMYANNSRLKIPSDYRDFLQSNGFFVLSGNKISLVHQSILDCFLAEHMLDQFYEDISISDIIGEKNRQTPGRRYQVQVFLQLLLEDSKEEFLSAGEKILGLKDIRYNIKYVFIEILSQIREPNDQVFKLVRRFLWDDEWGKHFRNMVVLGKQVYVRKFCECGDLDVWMQSEGKYNYVINLFSSIAPNFNRSDVLFLQKYVLDIDRGEAWSKCFVKDIKKGGDEFFNLQLIFFRQYPQFIERYKDVFLQEKIEDMRTIKLIALMLAQNADSELYGFYHYNEDCVLENAKVFREQYKDVFEILKQFIPMEEQKFFSKWSARISGRNSLKRVCIQILKSANREYAKNEPELFLSNISCYMGTAIFLHNELVLDSFRFLPDIYADYIVKYMCEDFGKRIFEDTSGNGDKLALAKEVLEKNASLCSDEIYSKLEFCIIHYLALDAKEQLKRRIEYNRTKTKGELSAYWNFWGYVQNDLLGILPPNRMSQEAKELRKVLGRSFGSFSIYQYDGDCRVMGVNPPVAGKKLRFCDWKRILVNNKLPLRVRGSHKEESGRYIDNSQEAYATEFQKAVSDAPDEFLNNVLNMEEEINIVFIKALARGIAYSKKHDEVENRSVEKLFMKYPYNCGTGIALAYCEIIEMKQDFRWSEFTIEMLCNIIKDRKVFTQEELAESSDDASDIIEKIESKILYSVSGSACRAIRYILCGNENMLEKFKVVFDELAYDDDFLSRYASLYVLRIAFNIDKNWAMVRITEMYKSDYRLAGFLDRGFLFALYDECKAVTQDVLRKGFFSDDETLQKRCSDTIAELYVIYDDFGDIIHDFPKLNDKQKDSIIRMFIVYYGIEKYHEKVKVELTRILEYNDEKIEDAWSSLFHKKVVCLSQDKDFLLRLLTSKFSAKIMFAFVRYLEKHGNILDYSEIIIKMAFSILEDADNDWQDGWLVERDLIKLIWGLYDEANSDEEGRGSDIVLKCLDIWDMMFEKQIGGSGELTRKMMEL